MLTDSDYEVGNVIMCSAIGLVGAIIAVNFFNLKGGVKVVMCILLTVVMSFLVMSCASYISQNPQHRSNNPDEDVGSQYR